MARSKVNKRYEIFIVSNGKEILVLVLQKARNGDLNTRFFFDTP